MRLRWEVMVGRCYTKRGLSEVDNNRDAILTTDERDHS